MLKGFSASADGRNPEKWTVRANYLVVNTAIEPLNGGIVAAAKIIADMFSSNAENAKALAYRLFTIAERKGWAGEAYAYNSLVIAWPDIQSKAAELKAQINNAKQMTLFDADI